MEVSVIKLGDVLASAVSCGGNGCLPEFKGVDEKRLASGKDRRRGNPDSQPAFVLNDDGSFSAAYSEFTDRHQCEDCGEDRQLVVHCAECGLSLCARCMDFHRKSSRTQHHVLTAFSANVMSAREGPGAAPRKSTAAPPEYAPLSSKLLSTQPLPPPLVRPRESKSSSSQLPRQAVVDSVKLSAGAGSRSTAAGEAGYTPPPAHAAAQNEALHRERVLQQTWRLEAEMTSTEGQHVRAAPPPTPAPAHPEQPWSWDKGRDVVMPFSDQWDTGRDVAQTSAPAASCGQAISSPLQAPCVTTVTTVTGGDAWCEGLVSDQDALGRGEAIGSSPQPNIRTDSVPERCYAGERAHCAERMAATKTMQCLMHGLAADLTAPEGEGNLSNNLKTKTLSLDLNPTPARPAPEGVIEGALPRLGQTDHHKWDSRDHKSERGGASPPPDGANADKAGSEGSGRPTGKKRVTVTGRIAAFLTGKKNTKMGR